MALLIVTGLRAPVTGLCVLLARKIIINDPLQKMLHVSMVSSISCRLDREIPPRVTLPMHSRSSIPSAHVISKSTSRLKLGVETAHVGCRQMNPAKSGIIFVEIPGLITQLFFGSSFLPKFLESFNQISQTILRIYYGLVRAFSIDDFLDSSVAAEEAKFNVLRMVEDNDRGVPISKRQ